MLDILAILTALALSGAQAEEHIDSLTARSQLSAGDSARLQLAFAKAQSGKPITVGVIGGSITQGAKASNEAHRYGNLVADWWRKTFPSAEITFINAGIGATGSSYGAMRIQRDLLARQLDFVIVEYAVNDPNTQASAETFEGVIRQILNQPNHPAVLLLLMMNRNGANAQEWFAKVGTHYGLPMVSYRDAFWPEIEAKRLRWEDLSPDEVHPNDRGHAEAARFVETALESARQHSPPEDKPPAIAPVPAPLLTGAYEFTALQEAAAMLPVTNQGWAYDEPSKSWKSEVPGSIIEFEIEGRTVFSMHHVIKGARGRATVSVDGAPPVLLEGWFNQTWGGYRQTNRIADGLTPGKHRVRFELREDKNPASTGNQFAILGLGAAGLNP
jgi:lysophospholipase L1-like esterase